MWSNVSHDISNGFCGTHSNRENMLHSIVKCENWHWTSNDKCNNMHCGNDVISQFSGWFFFCFPQLNNIPWLIACLFAMATRYDQFLIVESQSVHLISWTNQQISLWIPLFMPHIENTALCVFCGSDYVINISSWHHWIHSSSSGLWQICFTKC